ncbi:molybdopterin-dependent oxidoreductase [Celeribacter baekdonensis]|uniref:Pyrogallol hydroxytransferase large subunit n=1 Tax=Celeribacter baekdonensis TaxID=875171 RepID=A0A2R4M1K2_9RHOB|nr:molybdopterin-dependent oxidoreductase [Celeribacter baekdonensis]AVW91084.1 pyrogallol hydroxytransferase large subunit [Celeribacter baekdonensis]
MKETVLKSILFMLPKLLKRSARKFPVQAELIKRHNATVQIQTKDGAIGRWYRFENGKLSTKAGVLPEVDLRIIFKDVPTAVRLLTPPVDRGEATHAAKNFHILQIGPDHIAQWFHAMINNMDKLGLQYGMPMPDGSTRYTTNGNGGPTYVYVKNGKILRITPIDLQPEDAESYTITARGKEFRPKRRGTVNPHALSLKSQIYSDKRILKPMKRVDWDPNGERNPQTRGKSGYVEISWDEALDLVVSEIQRQNRKYGPGAMALYFGSHHQWGNVGYYLSALLRFGNMIGFTRIHPNPDSWEGWYWGATHHYGNSARVGIPSFYSTVEDALQNAEQIVFWSSDPESTSGYASGMEGTQRRFWAKELGIDFIHIDPNLNPTAQLYGGRWIGIRPGTDSALAHAIMNVWIKEGLYDKDYVAARTTGFDEWRAYILGESDGVDKTPEWQEEETGVPAHTCRALARSWGKKKTYLAAGGLGAGFGGACRNATGAQWARNMILMMAMQGLGKPGINFGNLQIGTPMDHNFYFPGYAEGGISGDLQFNANAVNNYQRNPHVLSMNPVTQMIPRLALAEAILEGKAKGFMWDGFSMEAQMTPFEYPKPGYPHIHMIYRYGSSTFGTIANSDRMIDAYRHESIDCVVNQSIWREGETEFADLILPACTSFERWDISEWGNSGGYIHHNTDQLNHRMVVMQHKCIEPLGESKSDYQIFFDILSRMGKGQLFSETCDELDWAKRIFDSSDIKYHMKWKDFVKKGYFVVPVEKPECRDAVAYRWFANGTPKDLPEPLPLPSQFGERFLEGLETQSGKIEFLPSTLKRAAPNEERPVLNRYIPAWEGRQTKDLFERFPLQLVTTHPRYSFHTYNDGKDSTTNDIPEHRVKVDGYYYWVMRIAQGDAETRGIRQHDLIRVYNERGSVICVADVTPLMAPGTCKAYESCAELDLIEHPVFGRVDRGGALNLLTPPRVQTKGTSGMGTNSCLIEFEKWTDTAAFGIAAE